MANSEHFSQRRALFTKDQPHMSSSFKVGQPAAANKESPLKNITNAQQNHQANGRPPVPPPPPERKGVEQNSAEAIKSQSHMGKPVAIPPTKHPIRHAEPLKLGGYVGFDTLPYQFVEKVKLAGFQFNLLCVGETGTGKTTLVESLFNTPMTEFPPCGHELSTVELREKTMEMVEGDVRVKLRIVETAGFGDQFGKEESVKVIVDYLNAQFEAYLREELKMSRQLAYYDDTRIHACLYFISPTGHGLKAMDVLTLRELSQRANVIPIIAKADTTSKEELVRFKQKIISELRANNIDLYDFPTDDETVRQQNLQLNKLMPFAVVGSTDFTTRQEDGRRVRARCYPWGVVEVENEEHCDFVKLREALLRVNQDALHERTHRILYERYRRERLKQMQMHDGDAAAPSKIEAYLARQQELKQKCILAEEAWERDYAQRVRRKDEDIRREKAVLTERAHNMREKFAKEMQELERQIADAREEHARLLDTNDQKKRKQKGSKIFAS